MRSAFKKIVIFLLCALMMVTPIFSACSKTPNDDNQEPSNPTEPSDPSDPGNTDDPGDTGDTEEKEPLVQYVNTLAGDLAKGATIAGPTMPNGSIHPSPETQNPENGGYRTGEKVVGFGQLYTQGTGGHQSYGNFLISPQVGEIKTSESDHASAVSEEQGTANYYAARLDAYDIFAEITPSNNAAMYRFTYPESDSSSLLIDISRKIGGDIALKSGSIDIDAENNMIVGGGTFTNNWNPSDWQMYVAIQFDKEPTDIGVWLGNDLVSGAYTAESSSTSTRLGAYVKFDTEEDEAITVKVAVSFESAQKAKDFLKEQLPDWDFESVKQKSADEWNDILHAVELGEGVSEDQKSKFYSALYFANVHPRNRTNDHGEWDDYYTIWDSWKSVFPFLTLTRPDMVADNINSFIRRYNENGMITDAYIQGKEYVCGQGGNDIENIIADAYVKDIDGVDWEDAYAAMKGNSQALRTEQYVEDGYQYGDKKAQNGQSYSYRLYPSSATMGFAYNDYAVATLAKGLGYMQDYEFYSERSHSWENIWNENLTSDGFTGFAQNKDANGNFESVSSAAAGWNSHYYEANLWEGSFYPVHDMDRLIEKMGGRYGFTSRLEYACENGHIRFDNEPAFQTVWLFSHQSIRRPDLTAKYANEFLSVFPEEGGFHNDEDGGGMSTMYMFLHSGFFPMSGTEYYYLHGTHLSEITYNLGNGNQFVIKGVNAGGDNIYVQSATFNGEPLNDCWLTHDQIMAGGTLEFVMGSEPSNWAKFEDDLTVPDSVTNLQADAERAQSGVVALSWSAPANVSVAKYLVYRGASEDFALTDSALVAEVTEEEYVGLAATGTYYYKVAAMAANGNVSANAPSVKVDVVQDLSSAIAAGSDVNIALNKTATASGESAPRSDPSAVERAAYAVDGNSATKWSCRSEETAPGDGTGNYWLQIDLGDVYVISHWRVLHAQAGGESADYNTKNFRLQAKIGNDWIDVDTVEGNTSRQTDRAVEPFAAQYVRLYITQPVQSGESVSARIYEFELYSSLEQVDFAEDFAGTAIPDGFTQSTSGGGQIDYSADGYVTLKTPTSGEVSLKKVFDDEFSGVMAHEVRFKNESSSNSEFANIMFLKTSGGDSVVTYAVETGRLRYHDGSGWKTVQFGGKDLYLLDNEYYTLKVVNDYTQQTSKVYLTGNYYGDGDKDNKQALGTEVYIGEFKFRNANVGNPDTFEMAIGSGKAHTSFTVDFIKTYTYTEV